MPDLEQILADRREMAAMLRRAGHGREAELLEAICGEVSQAAEPYLRWLTEEDAQLRSGRGTSWFRSRFPAWEREGNAKRDGRRRLYRQVIIPQRANPTAAREAGRAA